DVFTHRPVRTYFRDKQIHISGDVAYAVRQYVDVTGDRSLLEEGGVLTVAHGRSRAEIDAHHHGSAKHVSNGLMPADELARIFGEFLEVTAVVEDDRMYQVAGRAIPSPSDTASNG
ncbi:MAG: hypothetical protein IK035_04390, partial [Firmicutes bacterium]|nr:hypothetical protein [Bacillota bacterium]